MLNRSCVVCGAVTGGGTRCPTHADGGGTRPRRCLTCGTRTDGADYCADHLDPRTRQPWRVVYSTRAYRRARAEARQRDRDTCRCCGATGVPLEAHHLVAAKDGGHNTVDNLLTLCRPCHAARTLHRPCRH